MQAVPQPINPGSSSSQPDLNWSQIKETITMLCLATAQIEAAQKDATTSVSKLVNSFTKIANDSLGILHMSQALANDHSGESQLQQLELSASTLNKEINDSIVSFQFHDRISQKLSHVNHGLYLLANLISDASRIYNPIEWRQIQDEIAKSYSLECERIMLKKILEGESLIDVLNDYHDKQQSTPPSQAEADDIELF